MIRLWVLFASWEVYYLIWAISALITTQKNIRVKKFLFQLLAVFFVLPFTSLAIWLEITLYPEYVLLLSYSISTYIGFTLLIIGLAFSIWARIKLGRNWSGSVEILPNHKLVRDGPFKVVRHPIYLGMILGTLGTSLILGEIITFIVFITSVFTLIQKSQNEEKLLLEKFGLEYDQYKKEVKSFIPFLI